MELVGVVGFSLKMVRAAQGGGVLCRFDSVLEMSWIVKVVRNCWIRSKKCMRFLGGQGL